MIFSFLSDNMVLREEIEIEGIPIILERKNIKNLYLRIKPDGTVKVSSPMRLSDDAINEFVLSRIDWIRDTRAKMLENPPKPKVKYKDGETHYIWGEPYTLQLISNEMLKRLFMIVISPLFISQFLKGPILSREKRYYLNFIGMK